MRWAALPRWWTSPTTSRPATCRPPRRCEPCVARPSRRARSTSWWSIPASARRAARSRCAPAATRSSARTTAFWKPRWRCPTPPPSRSPRHPAPRPPSTGATCSRRRPRRSRPAPAAPPACRWPVRCRTHAAGGAPRRRDGVRRGRARGPLGTLITNIPGELLNGVTVRVGAVCRFRCGPPSPMCRRAAGRVRGIGGHGGNRGAWRPGGRAVGTPARRRGAGRRGRRCLTVDPGHVDAAERRGDVQREVIAGGVVVRR